MNEKKADETGGMRLDKWLWCARFYKTRSLAADAIKSGKVRVNGDRPKPSKTIGPGDSLSIRKEAYKYEIFIRDLPRARLPAAKAVRLYEETEESINQRDLTSKQLKLDASMFPRSPGRPTKRDRRDLMKFKKTRTGD